MTEGIIGKYLEELSETTNPGVHLAKFYWEAVRVEPDVKDIRMFNKFISLYGRERVFYAIVSIANIEKVNTENIYGLVKYFLDKEIRGKIKPTDSLESYAKNTKKELMKIKRTKIDFEMDWD